jgi:glycosyltransferase involved in cell wall biosynthesis
MRVLVVSQARYGVRNVIQHLLKQLRDADGVDPAYLTIPTHEAPEGVEQVSLLSKSRLDRYEGKRFRYLGYAVLNFWRRAYDWLEANHEGYDVVWFHTPRLLPLSPGELFPKLLVTYHNHLLSEVARHYDRPMRWYYSGFGALEARGLRRAATARYTVVNPAVVEELRERGVPADRIRYVENGVDTDRFHPGHDTASVVSEYNLPTDVPVVLSLGRLKEQKRPALLVERFADVSAALDGHVHLAVAGTGARGDAARRVAAECNLDNVQFLGYVPEEHKEQLYAVADYYVLPSSYEGSPLALYEALASGTPAIVSDLPGTRFVAEEDCGLVASFEDDSDVSRIAEYITTDDDHPANARCYAETHLDWAARTAEYREEFEKIHG